MVLPNTRKNTRSNVVYDQDRITGIIYALVNSRDQLVTQNMMEIVINQTNKSNKNKTKYECKIYEKRNSRVKTPHNNAS